MISKTNIAVIRLFNFSFICLWILCASCTKEEQDSGVRIETSRYQILVDNTKVDLAGPIVFGRSDITQAYRAYRYDKQVLMYIPSIVGFDNLFVDGDTYYVIAIREERTLNTEDGGSTYYLEKVIDRQTVLPDTPFE